MKYLPDFSLFSLKCSLPDQVICILICLHRFDLLSFRILVYFSLAVLFPVLSFQFTISELGLYSCCLCFASAHPNFPWVGFH